MIASQNKIKAVNSCSGMLYPFRKKLHSKIQLSCAMFVLFVVNHTSFRCTKTKFKRKVSNCNSESWCQLGV